MSCHKMEGIENSVAKHQFTSRISKNANDIIVIKEYWICANLQTQPSRVLNVKD